jgi:hypothetical protein
MHLKCACQTCFSGFRLGSLLVLGRPLALSQTLAHLGLFHCTSILKRGHQMPQRMLQARTLSDRNTSCLILEHDPVCNIDFDPVLLKFLLIWQFCIFFKKWGHRVPQHYTCTESPQLNAPLLALVFFVKWRHRMPQHYSCIDPSSDIFQVLALKLKPSLCKYTLTALVWHMPSLGALHILTRICTSLGGLT